MAMPCIEDCLTNTTEAGPCCWPVHQSQGVIEDDWKEAVAQSLGTKKYVSTEEGIADSPVRRMNQNNEVFCIIVQVQRLIVSLL